MMRERDKMQWALHWLEADGDLGPWRDRVAAELEAARQAIAKILPPLRIDILIQRGSTVIPEIGMVGHAFRPTLFTLTLDPGNPNFEACLDAGALRRMVAHEAHHCGRMASIGHGHTLGDALVSEGLAGRFVGHLFGSPPDPWECAVDDDTMRAHLPDATALAATDYGHDSWFFGVGGARPRWLGYTLGYRIAGDWLATVPAPDGPTWVGVPAATVLDAARNTALNPGHSRPIAHSQRTSQSGSPAPSNRA